MTTAGRWLETWQALEVADTPSLRNGYEEVVAHYSEPHRRYHTVRHLAECFAQWSDLRPWAERPGEVELALWFHDAVYDVSRDDNEARSANWAHSCALAAGVGREVADRVRTLVMFTRHAAEPVGIDAQVLVDTDLSILGAAPERFDEYERQVREEYEWVPEFVFRRKRQAILEEMLARPRIFSTALFFRRYEDAARSNLARSITRLAAVKRLPGDLT
jgi:predicted metal-dependent HD superfamily phosphohydrolase